MREYRQPETRIKRVKDEKGQRYYAEYKQVIIPYIWWEWQYTRPSLCDKEFTWSLREAKERIDQFLLKSKHQWACDIEKAEQKRNKEIEYIKYP